MTSFVLAVVIFGGVFILIQFAEEYSKETSRLRTGSKSPESSTRKQLEKERLDAIMNKHREAFMFNLFNISLTTEDDGLINEDFLRINEEFIVNGYSLKYLGFNYFIKI